MAARHQYYYSCALSLSVCPPFFYYMYYACKLVTISLCPTQQTPPFCFPCCDVCFPALKLLSLGTPDASQPEFTTNTWCSLIAAATCSAHTIALQQKCSFFLSFPLQETAVEGGYEYWSDGWAHFGGIKPDIPSFLPSFPRPHPFLSEPTSSFSSKPIIFMWQILWRKLWIRQWWSWSWRRRWSWPILLIPPILPLFAHHFHQFSSSSSNLIIFTWKILWRKLWTRWWWWRSWPILFTPPILPLLLIIFIKCHHQMPSSSCDKSC